MDGNPVMGTADDAATCRLYCHLAQVLINDVRSCAIKEYFSDPFARFFVKNSSRMRPKPPIINRGIPYLIWLRLLERIGTYARTMAVNHYVSGFLKSFVDAQIVSLGAGMDTLYFNLKTRKVLSLINWLNNLPELVVGSHLNTLK